MDPTVQTNTDLCWDFRPGLAPVLSFMYLSCTSFSNMKRLKTTLRSTMTDKGLRSLAIMHIHKQRDVNRVAKFASL